MNTSRHSSTASWRIHLLIFTNKAVISCVIVAFIFFFVCPFLKSASPSLKRYSELQSENEEHSTSEQNEEYGNEQKYASLDKTSDHHKLLHILQKVVFNLKFCEKESSEVLEAYYESIYLRNFAEIMEEEWISCPKPSIKRLLLKYVLLNSRN
ncbi:hypothetical protein K501DRAFT_266027 [Backusella circina FSU 941]|nr:hypothetical protein K501DRAFT_266027 [Backusella circina FSU 941]